MDLFDVRNLGQEPGVVLVVELLALFREELLAHVCPLVELLGSQLNVDEISFLQDLVHLVHLLPLQLVNVPAHLVEEVIDRVANGIPQIELLAVCDQEPILSEAV